MSKALKQNKTKKTRKVNIKRKRVKYSTPDEKQMLNEARDEIIEKIVMQSETPKSCDISNAYKISSITLGDYVTLDWQHAKDIEKLVKQLRGYIKDTTRTRPHNVMIIAPPGSGKSHFIKCLAEALSNEHVTEVTFNMANMQGPRDLVNPLERVRNLEVDDKKFPLLFLDEFDSHEDHFSTLLPLLWEGQINIGNHDLKIGKTIIVLAGNRKEIQNSMRLASTMSRDVANGISKIVDLLSRINGMVFRIPSLDETSGDRDRRTDKVCVAIFLLKRRFKDKKIEQICWSLLKFISTTSFRYGVRSIAHLIDCIPANAIRNGQLNNAKLLLPPLRNVSDLESSSLLYHIISTEGASAVVQMWSRLVEVDKPVIVKSEV